MKTKIKKHLKEIIVFILVLIVAMNVVSYYRSLELNKQQLDIKSFKLLDGSSYAIKDDKPLIIYFWATWCPVCKFQSPNIQKLSEKYEVITIATQSGSKKDIENYLKEKGLSFKVVDDSDAYYSQKFNIKVFPTTFIYDKDKNLKFSEVGYTSTLGLYIRMFFSDWY